MWFIEHHPGGASESGKPLSMAAGVKYWHCTTCASIMMTTAYCDISRMLLGSMQMTPSWLSVEGARVLACYHDDYECDQALALQP